MRAVLIGAGKIGRGFIGQVLHAEGFDLTFIDVSKPLIDLLNQHGRYPVYILGGSQKEYWVENVRAYEPDSPEAIRALAEADIVTTAVGPPVLAQTAAYIARGIQQRCANHCHNPLTVIACENMEYGSTALYNEVVKHLEAQELEYCSQYVGFPDAEVSRIAIPMEAGESSHPLAVKVEQYIEWIIDRHKLKENLIAVKSFELTDNPTAYIKRKIYTLTGHAMLGYLGYAKGYEYIYEAAYDNGIFGQVYGALKECAGAWSREYAMPEEEFNLYTTIMLRRFSDTRLKDFVERVCFQPIRKLARNERFIGPAITALQHGIYPIHIIDGIISALQYNSPKDEQAIKLQDLRHNQGIEAVLQTVCGLVRRQELFGLILNRYNGSKETE